MSDTPSGTSSNPGEVIAVSFSKPEWMGFSIHQHKDGLGGWYLKRNNRPYFKLTGGKKTTRIESLERAIVILEELLHTLKQNPPMEIK